MQQALCHCEVITSELLQLRGLPSVCLNPRGSRARLRSNRRPARKEQGHQDHTFEIVRFPQIAVPDRIGVPRQLPAPQVHDQEGKVVQHVDAGNIVVELDRVEQRGLAVEQDDVAKVEVTMALAHRAVLPPRVEQRALTFQFEAGVAGHPSARGLIEDAGALVCEPRSIPLCDPHHSGCTTVIPPRLGAAVEPCECTCQSRHRVQSQSSICGKSIEQGPLVETSHLDDPINRLSRTPQGERPVGRACDRHHSAIQRRRGASIETHFGLAEDLSATRGREIEVVESNRALELPGARACQKHDRRMRVDSFDRHPAMGGRRAEKTR